MSRYPPDSKDTPGDSPASPYDPDPPAEDDLWFLPGPPGDDPGFLSPLPRAEDSETVQIAGWRQAQGEQAAHLARVAARFGALDERLRRGPEGWRQRLALLEASGLSWLTGDRVAADRLALWQALRVSAAGEDTGALQRIAWAFRRLAGGPGPEADPAGFLGRYAGEGDSALSDKIAAWERVMLAAAGLHPIVRGGFACHLWPLAGIGAPGDRLEGAVIAARMAAAEGQGGAVFAPLAMGGGAGGLGGGEAPPGRLRRWLQVMEQGLLKAMRHLDQLEAWETQARAQASGLSGRTPPLLIRALRDWPLVSAPMAADLTGASRAAVQRNLIWFERHGLVDEVTGQGRFRMWKAAL